MPRPRLLFCRKTSWYPQLTSANDHRPLSATLAPFTCAEKPHLSTCPAAVFSKKQAEIYNSHAHTPLAAAPTTSTRRPVRPVFIGFLEPCGSPELRRTGAKS